MAETTQDFTNPVFIENVLRINPDVIYTSDLIRAQQTAQEIQTILSTYRNKTVEIITDVRLANADALLAYKELIQKDV